jgi:hypothetical protein
MGIPKIKQNSQNIKDQQPSLQKAEIEILKSKILKKLLDDKSAAKKLAQIIQSFLK